MLIVKPGYTYYSQRNNAINPYNACQVTSMIQALDILGYTFPEGKEEQPEDRLMAYITGRGGNPEYHGTLSSMTNAWLKQDVTFFSTAAKIENILADLDAGAPVILSGDFPGYPTLRPQALGHVVTMIGYRKDNDIIIADPYGDTMNDWKGSGREVHIPWDLFLAWFKPTVSTTFKWAHRFKGKMNDLDKLGRDT